MAVGDAHVFPGFLTPVLTQLFFPKPPTTFLTCFCRGERRKYAGKKVCLNRGSNSQPPGNESDMLTPEPPRRGLWEKEKMLLFPQCFLPLPKQISHLHSLLQMLSIWASPKFFRLLKSQRHNYSDKKSKYYPKTEICFWMGRHNNCWSVLLHWVDVQELACPKKVMFSND